MMLDQDNANIINDAKSRRSTVLAVGTTTMKALETTVNINGKVVPFSGWTNKFIFPPYEF